jgi:hypothetical protein
LIWSDFICFHLFSFVFRIWKELIIIWCPIQNCWSKSKEKNSDHIRFEMRWDEMRWDEMRWDESCCDILVLWYNIRLDWLIDWLIHSSFFSLYFHPISIHFINLIIWLFKLSYVISFRMIIKFDEIWKELIKVWCRIEDDSDDSKCRSCKFLKIFQFKTKQNKTKQNKTKWRNCNENWTQKKSNHRTTVWNGLHCNCVMSSLHSSLFDLLHSLISFFWSPSFDFLI